MGRHPKKVATEIGIDRRETGYYSTPDFICEFIADTLIELNPNGESALDPCVGCGEMALPLAKRGISVDGMDILSLNMPEDINFIHQDFLDFYRDNSALNYDFYIANPPYNCHEVSYIKDRKPDLIKVFDKVGIHNMYSMFMYALIKCAKEGAFIAIITLDSFLTAKTHTSLRYKLLQECALHYLILCPSHLFLNQGADVRTCISIFQKGKQYQGEVNVANRALDIDEFKNILKNNLFSKLSLNQIVLSSEKDNSELIINLSNEIRTLFSLSRLGNQFPCITGISTGNDRQYLSKAKRPGFNVPFYKNPGSSRFFTQPNAYLTDDFLAIAEEIPNFMVRNKQLLYQPGITCSSMGVLFSACYLPSNSTYGVNANIIISDDDLWWLLAYLNSHLVTYLVRGVLNRSNMITSGYVSRLPVPKIGVKGSEKLSQIAREAYTKKILPNQANCYIIEVNKIIQQELCLSEETIAMLKHFSQNILQAT